MKMPEPAGDKFNHLESPASKITICLETYSGPYYKFKLPENVETLKKYAEDICWLSNPLYYRKHNIKSNNEGTYAISEASEKDKYSEGYLNCTGLVMTGTDKETGDVISIVTHQQSDSTTLPDKDKFQKDFVYTTRDFMERCKPK